jgi:hypothetical protein
VPFRVGVVMDNNELGGTAAIADLNERTEHPGGITGFKLDYFQVAC